MNYQSYIQEFAKEVDPGEHHFVAIYLVPLIKRRFGILPTFVNPDGMKRKLGDLLYPSTKKGGKSETGLEIKWNKIKLTAIQMKQRTAIDSPDCLIVCTKKKNPQIGFAEWLPFAEEYCSIKDARIDAAKKKWKKLPDYTKYGPQVDHEEFKSISWLNEKALIGRLEGLFT